MLLKALIYGYRRSKWENDNSDRIEFDRRYGEDRYQKELLAAEARRVEKIRKQILDLAF